jgi:hypothetical protein
MLSGVLALSTASPGAFGALLEGKVMQAELRHQSMQSSPQEGVISPEFVVGPGVELPGFGDETFPPLPELVDIDISDRQILMTLLIDQPFAFGETFHIIDARDTIDTIQAVLINPATNWAGFNSFRVGTTGERITVDVAQLAGLQGQQILVDVVPEPASAVLLMTAIAAVTLGGRRSTGARSLLPRRLLTRRSHL